MRGTEECGGGGDVLSLPSCVTNATEADIQVTYVVVPAMQLGDHRHVLLQ